MYVLSVSVKAVPAFVYLVQGVARRVENFEFCAAASVSSVFSTEFCFTG